MKRTALLTALPVALAFALPAWAGKAHEHGVARLDVAVDGNTLTIALDTPLDGLLGFERAPRSEAERRAAEKAVATLRAADALFAIDPAVRCTSSSVTLESAPLKLGAATPSKEDGHGDLEGEFVFRCEAVPAFVDAGLFKAFPRMSRLDVQVATPKGQRRQVLKRPAQRIALPR